jgi:hypothetical protein
MPHSGHQTYQARLFSKEVILASQKFAESCQIVFSQFGDLFQSKSSQAIANSILKVLFIEIEINC